MAGFSAANVKKIKSTQKDQPSPEHAVRTSADRSMREQIANGMRLPGRQLAGSNKLGRRNETSEKKRQADRYCAKPARLVGL
jgi:hypothetical protein